MKHVRTFENLKEPQVGDYVICEQTISTDEKLYNFITNNVGIIVEHRKHFCAAYRIHYENAPKEIRKLYINDNNIVMERKEIIHFSKNKEYLEDLLATNKYNL